jgi:hypothetical protein
VDVAILTVACLAALALAATFAIRWGGLAVSPRPLLTADPPPPKREALLRYLRACAIAFVGGAIAGPLVLGFGGRLAMRITAATSSDRAQGVLTEAEETVGEITFGGTLGLIVFVGLFGGLIGAFAYLLLRRWLRGPAWRAGAIVGLLGLAVVGRAAALDPDNIDFEILTPRWLAVAMFVALAPLFGIVLAALIERLDRSYPTLAARPGAIAAHAPLALFAFAAPFVVVIIAGALIATFAPRLRVLASAWQSTAVTRTGQIVLGVVIVAGLVWIATGVPGLVTAG